MSYTPCLVIAGTHSGCGKTTVATGIMGALVGRGLCVQPFKVGPDFIDPSHHTAICQRHSRNLDPYMMGDEGVRQTYARATEGADIAVVEGVMGMYDGVDGTLLGSTAHVAEILNIPVVLVVDAKGMSLSACAMVKGYRDFTPERLVEGVIFNNIGSIRHREMIQGGCETPVLGWIPHDSSGEIESRHLGLKMAHETKGLGIAAQLVEEHCRIDELIGIARAPDIAQKAQENDETGSKKVRLGVAMDEAFCFYYQDNLDLLRKYGADLVFFSPLKDSLPDVDGLYLGGGYPELYASELAASPSKKEIKKALEEGMPAYAECGGLTYLCESITIEGETTEMASVLPGHATKKERFQALGYVDARVTEKNGILPRGISCRGHEFHYTSLECDSDARFALTLQKGRGIDEGRDGLYEYNVLAGYTHAYFTEVSAKAIIQSLFREQRT